MAAALAVAIGCLAADARAQAPVAVPASRQAAVVALVPVHGEIDAVTRTSVERRIGEAAAAGAGAAVLELDTPGGDMYATLELCLWLKDRAPIPVWAWVRPKAYSAGTIIALACRGILVSTGAAFGDAAPISAVPGLGIQPLPAAERAKLEAPVLAEVVDSARRRGYDETLVRAFVSAPDEVWMLERDDGSARIFVGRQEYREAFGQEPPTTRMTERTTERSTGAPRLAATGDAPLLPFVDLSLRRPRRDDGPHTEAERDAMVEDQQAKPPVRERLGPGTAAGWHVVGQVDGADELLVTYAPEAIAFGLAQREVADERALSAWFGANSVLRADENLGDALVRFLTSWPVRLALVAVLVCGFVVECAVPGLGWFGAASAVALALLVGAPALAGIAAWWPLVVVLAGAGLIVAELFLAPGVMLLGALGGACVIVGLVAAFLDAPLGTPEGHDDLATAIGTVAGGGILAAGAAWAILRALPGSALARHAVLETAVGGGAPPAPTAGVVPEGTRGLALTPLRPVGKAEFGGRIAEVQAIGAMIDAGAHVVVVRSTPYALEVEEDRA